MILQKHVKISEHDYRKRIAALPDERTADIFTKKILYTAAVLFDFDFSELNKENTGAVISTRTGPYQSVKAVSEIIQRHGYRGINPSRFPNVMLSTALSRLVRYLGIHGPACAFYDCNEDHRDAKQYCEVLLSSCRCRGLVLICADENGEAAGKYFIFGK